MTCGRFSSSLFSSSLLTAAAAAAAAVAYIDTALALRRTFRPSFSSFFAGELRSTSGISSFL